MNLPPATGRPLSEFIDRVVTLCPLPASAQRILALTNDPDVEIKEVGRVLSTDPALAAEVMRLANSAVYSRGVAATDLVQAILKLGLGELRQMAGAMAILAAFPTETEFSTSMRTVSVLSGAVARDLAQKTGLASAGTAYVCGLLAEVGAMACAAIDGPFYVALHAQSANDWAHRARRERERYGYLSSEIGSALLSRNHLPDAMVQAVLGSVDTPASSLTPLARITVFARHAAPILIDTAAKAEPVLLGERLVSLAQQVGLPTIEPADLAALCLQATTAAVSALSGPSRR
jgi:HD-like signal output (HDOD) protein